ncbi:MAG: 30S ribosomal protein S11 [candidate division Zixibacteria bacterium]|nr:30S ribosomal protein S11 [candidate division Zixibacteria bacterium]
MAKVKKKAKRKVKRTVSEGIVYIKSSFNNTLVTIADREGNVVAWASGGLMGFKGSRKSTPFAAQRSADQAAKRAVAAGMMQVEIQVVGPGSGRESAVRAIQASGLRVTGIKDRTKMPHDGCRARKRRRV